MDLTSSPGYFFTALLIILFSVLLLSISTYLQDHWLTRKGVLPSVEKTTLEDIKRLRDEGKISWAIKRFRQLPENKNKYTLRGAKEVVEGL